MYYVCFQVTHFHHSVLATKALNDHQEGKGQHPPLHLIQDVPTRWNSQLAMMRRLLKLKVGIIDVLHNESVIKPSDRKTLELSNNTWKVFVTALHSIL